MGADSSAQVPGLHVPPFPWGDTPEEEHYARKGVRNERKYIDSGRGLQLYTQSWVPLKKPVRAVMFMVHGYGNDTSWTFQNTAMLFTDMGCASFALDLEGHGRSDGLKGYIPDINAVTHDCYSHFMSIKLTEGFAHLPCFLYGESMGGAICLLLHFMDRDAWDGAILVAPMCKISDKMRPPWPVAKFLQVLAKWAPTWPIVPTKDFVDKSIKDPIKRELGRNNPQRYAGKPRLGTTATLLKTTAFLEEHLQDVDMPFLVIHGDADVVTDPSVSRALFENSRSSDKTIRIYEGMMHSLLQGEYDDNVSIILADICSWLDAHIKKKVTCGCIKQAL
ncbi:hypothetical protein GOP47_0019859 [Adiantum capillus-veneris]|uniref:Serine aminopeptidase S33 domain-containing protein n=1 Tax=Adiantum capillus-veneris TaxID=13818 RepID=A0A9D4UBV1_ADICA|nr:hypothetical protein GOP47_0019859 [Adiantum capillus-veneris]